jgi:hypothetical protein
MANAVAIDGAKVVLVVLAVVSHGTSRTDWPDGFIDLAVELVRVRHAPVFRSGG